MGNGYGNLLWKLLFMNNNQGKQVIYYIKKKKYNYHKYESFITNNGKPVLLLAIINNR